MHLLVLSILVGYALGMFQTGYIMGRLHGIDIREHGSKNAGMTNVNRTLGKWPALIVFVVDILKAALAFVLLPALIFGAGWSFSEWGHVFYGERGFAMAAPLLSGFGAVLGHNFPFYLKFRGGKGIACTIGIILMFSWQIALVAFGLGILLVAVFRYISLASLAITFVWPILLFAFAYDLALVLIALCISLLAWFMHRENIARLASRTERRFTLGK